MEPIETDTCHQGFQFEDLLAVYINGPLIWSRSNQVAGYQALVWGELFPVYKYTYPIYMPFDKTNNNFSGSRVFWSCSPQSSLSPCAMVLKRSLLQHSMRVMCKICNALYTVPAEFIVRLEVEPHKLYSISLRKLPDNILRETYKAYYFLRACVEIRPSNLFLVLYKYI
jgi:hypothetical protein